MDIKQILDDYEDAKKQKEAGEKERLESERLRRQLNAEKVELHLQSVVEPVFNAAKTQLHARGYGCEVEFTSRADSNFPSSKRTFALALKLKTGRDSEATSKLLTSSLEFRGDFDSVTVSVEVTGSFEKPRRTGPMVLDDLTREKVEQQLDAFLRAVFTARRDA